MITLITNIHRQENNSIAVQTTAVNSTETSSISGASQIVLQEAKDLNATVRGSIASSLSSIVRLCSYEKTLVEQLCRPVSEQEEMQNKVKQLEEALAASQKVAEHYNQLAMNIRNEFVAFKQSVANVIQVVQATNTGVDSATVVTQQPVATSVSGTINGAMMPAALVKGVAILNATLLNEAISKGIKLEPRTCKICGNDLIAPETVSDKDIVCAKCEPQAIEQLQPLPTTLNPFGEPVATLNPFGDPLSELFTSTLVPEVPAFNPVAPTDFINHCEGCEDENCCGCRYHSCNDQCESCEYND